jgi:exopolyphosphatase/guanosine-5'-triphosphate,3'-diphosphate pyrophosphatase
LEFHRDRVPRIVDRLKEQVALGADGLSARVLTHDAAARAEAALSRIKTLADRRGADHFMAYATSAIREARNGRQFIARIRRRIGIDVRVIPGEMEAELIYLGVRDSVDLTEPSLLIDIGGGSTEFVVGDRETMHLATSLKLGASRLTERFVRTDPISGAELADLTAHIDDQLTSVLDAARQHGVRQLVGSSGTIENLGALAHHRSGRAGTPFQHAISREAMIAVADQIARSSRAEREAIAQFDPHRAGQVVAGAVLLKRVLASLPVERLLLSPAALREGMVVRLIREQGEEFARVLEEPDLGRRRCLELGIRHRFDEAHARETARLADRLFEDLARLHKLGDRPRRILDRAALTHDLGHAISGRRHHKHTRYIIEQARWTGVRQEEVELIAMVARYHRGAAPRKEHGRYRRLGKKSRRLVQQLSALLRLANNLDRSHVQNTRDLRVEIGREAVRVVITTRADPELELRAAERARGPFEHAFDRRLEILADPPK